MAIDPTALPAGQPQAGVNPIDPNLYLSTPEGYATPEQLQAARAYAQALQASSIKSPVKSWQQGVSNIVQALVGGNLSYQQGQKEIENQRMRASSAMPGGPAAAPIMGAPPPATPSSAPASFGKLPALGEDAGKSSMNGGGATPSDAAAITKNESGGNYSSVGPAVHGNDHAYGRYQVLGANIPAWTKEVLGRSLTPQEFLSSPAAQDMVFRTKFGQYRDKYGPQGAARAWFAGEGNMNNPNAHDVLGTTVAGYEKNFDKTAGLPTSNVAGGPPTQLAFNGKSPPAANPLSDMSAFADKQGAAPQQGPLNGGWDPHPTLPPNSIPVAPIYSREQVMQRLADPLLTDSERRVVVGDYMSQFQPVQMKVTGGTVLINRMNPTQQKFIPDVEKATVKYPGGYEAPAPYVMGPMGGSVTRLPVTMPGGAPVAAPGGAPGGAPPAPAGGGPLPFAPTGGPAGGPPVGAPAAGPAAPAGGAPMPPIPAPGPQGALTPPPGMPPAGPQVASLDPTAGVAAAAPKAMPAPLPAATAAAANAPLAAAPPAPAPGPRIAGLDAPPPGVPPADWDAIHAFNRMAVEQERNKEGATKQADLYAKRYEDQNNSALKVENETIPQLQLAQSILRDPNNYTGIGADAVLNWERVKAAWGKLTGDKSQEFAAAPQELFRKIAASNVLGNLRAATQGTGQIRLAEIHLLQQATMDPHNTVAANLALTEIAMRGAQRLSMFNDMAHDYMSGNAVVDPLDPKHIIAPANTDRNGQQVGRYGLDPGYDKMLASWIKQHPAFTPEETKNYEQTFTHDKQVKVPEAGAGAAKEGAAGGGSMPTITTKDQYDALQPGTTFTGADGKQYTKPGAK